MVTLLHAVRELFPRFLPYFDVENPHMLGLLIVGIFGGLSALYVLFQWQRKMSIHWMKQSALAKRRFVRDNLLCDICLSIVCLPMFVVMV